MYMNIASLHMSTVRYIIEVLYICVYFVYIKAEKNKYVTEKKMVKYKKTNMG